MNQRWLAGSDEHRVYQLAREAVTKALELDPADAMAHAVQGTIAMGYDRDFPGAARHYQRALELASNNYDILQQAGWFLGMLGRTDEAIAVHEHLTQREPLNPMAPGCLAWLHNSARQPEAAIEAARMTMRVSPNFVDNQCALGWGLLGSGRPEEALTAIEKETNPNVRLWSLSAAHWALGNTDEAKAATAELIADYGRRSPMLIAAAVAGQGDVDGASSGSRRQPRTVTRSSTSFTISGASGAPNTPRIIQTPSAPTAAVPANASPLLPLDVRVGRRLVMTKEAPSVATKPNPSTMTR